MSYGTQKAEDLSITGSAFKEMLFPRHSPQLALQTS